MNLKIIIFYIIILLSSNIARGQQKDLLPQDVLSQLFGTWLDEKTNQVSLVITNDYLVVEGEIWYYKYVNTDDNIKITTTCVNSTGTNIFQFFVNPDEPLYFYYNRKYLELVKDNDKVKLIPNSLVGNWISSDEIIKIKNKDQVIYKGEVFVCDYIIKSKEKEYNLILYKSGNYYTLDTKMLKGEMVIQALGLTNQVFFKESFFQKHRTLFIVLGIILGLLSLSFLFKWKINVNKKKEIIKRKLAETQLKSIRSQMNPHFIFNALSAIQNLINKNDNEKANHYLTEFSQLMRLTLDKSEKGIVPLSDEIESIKKYLDLENLRFKFDYTLKVDPEIDIYQIEIPAMLVQPFVENAIIHGLNEIESDKKLSVEFKKTGSYLQCVVEDNGIGIKASKLKKQIVVKKMEYGRKLAEDRIALINESLKTNAKIVIIDLSDYSKHKSGTRVEIFTPLNY